MSKRRRDHGNGTNTAISTFHHTTTRSGGTAATITRTNRTATRTQCYTRICYSRFFFTIPSQKKIHPYNCHHHYPGSWYHHLFHLAHTRINKSHTSDHSTKFRWDLLK